MIIFQNVTKTYADNNVVALHDATFHIQKGEFVFIVGPSGAGKSTITKLMTCEELPDSGSIRVGEFDISKMAKQQIPYLRRSMGIVFQDFRLLPNKTVYENVSFAMEVIGASKKAIRRRVPDVLSMVNLTAKARSYPHQLSGGEQQRVGIARALANTPHLIIADEPTGNVDPNMSYEIVNLLTEINKRGTTILMVTHDHNLVRDFKHRVIMLDSGRIVADNAAGGAE